MVLLFQFFILSFYVILFLDKVFAFSFFLCYTLYGDYMRNRGFTLVELLGVVFILALLGLLITPVIYNVINDKRRDLYDVQIRNIEQGAQGYVSEHIFEIDIPAGTSRGISLGTLQRFGYVKDDIINPLTRQNFSSDLIIVITNKATGFEYKVCVSDSSCESVVML